LPWRCIKARGPNSTGRSWYCRTKTRR